MPDKPRILLVEDDRSLVELLSFHLRRSEFEVETTADGEDALLMAREAPPDLVILDWMIEGISGLSPRRASWSPGSEPCFGGSGPAWPASS